MLKKYLVALVLLIVSTSVFALPPTTIEKVYYSSAAKTEIVGYYYVGCIISSSVSWGVRTRYFDNGMRHDCTHLGNDEMGDSGFCIINGIYDEIRNSGGVYDFMKIKDACD